MLAKIYTGTIIGLDGLLIEVEVDVANRGLPSFTIVGLPSKAIDEAKDRVRSAIVQTGFRMPDNRITINLAPADLPKEGSSFDLPIAVGLLAASGLVKQEIFSESLFVGELSLEGRVRGVNGAINLALLTKKLKKKNLFISTENAVEASLAENIDVYPVFDLRSLVFHLNQIKTILPQPKFDWHLFEKKIIDSETDFDFSEIKGQEQAKRALLIAAAGFHNLHMKGPPGTGKTLLSRAFNSILPPMEKKEIIEVSKIYSVAGLLEKNKLIIKRPFRSPHHTTSRIGLIGGGTKPMPGEISLAHRGVLFLDELAEFPRSVLEALRQPLEDGYVVVSRASGSVQFPSRFMLLAASNPCPCGYLGHPKKPCRCSPGAIVRYKKRISGPLLDRIDLHVEVPVISEKDLTNLEPGESSKKIQEKVVEARNRQKTRYLKERFFTNAELTPAKIREYCQLTNQANDLLKQAISRFSLSGRSYFKIIKIAQTIADIERKEKIEVEAIAEALQYREQEDFGYGAGS